MPEEYILKPFEEIEKSANWQLLKGSTPIKCFADQEWYDIYVDTFEGSEYCVVYLPGLDGGMIENYIKDCDGYLLYPSGKGLFIKIEVEGEDQCFAAADANGTPFSLEPTERTATEWDISQDDSDTDIAVNSILQDVLNQLAEDSEEDYLTSAELLKIAEDIRSEYRPGDDLSKIADSIVLTYLGRLESNTVDTTSAIYSILTAMIEKIFKEYPRLRSLENTDS